MSNKVRWIDDQWLYTTKVYSLSDQNGPIRVRLNHIIVHPLVLFGWYCRTHEAEQSCDWYVYPIDQLTVLIMSADTPYPFAQSSRRLFYCDFVTPLNGVVYRIMADYVPNQQWEQ